MTYQRVMSHADFAAVMFLYDPYYGHWVAAAHEVANNISTGLMICFEAFDESVGGASF